MLSASLVEQMLEHLYDAVIVTDMEGVITHWNNGAERVFGYVSREAIGKKPAVLYDPEAAQVFENVISKDIAKHGSWTGEIRFFRKNGEAGICESTVASLLDHAGTPLGSVAVNRDVTSLRLAEEQIERLVELERQVADSPHKEGQHQEPTLADEERLSLISELANCVSHNLNNMLTPAVCLLDLVLAEPGLNERCITWLQAIKKSTTDTSEVAQRLGSLFPKQKRAFKPEELKDLVSELRTQNIGEWLDENIRKKPVAIEILDSAIQETINRHDQAHDRLQPKKDTAETVSKDSKET